MDTHKTTDPVTTIKQFLASQVSVQANTYDQAAAIPESLLAQGQALGLFDQRHTPVQAFWEIHEATGYHCSSLRSLQTVNNMGLHALDSFGSEALKASFQEQTPGHLPKLISFALTENHAGSQARKLELNAERVGSHYILNGEKSWVTGAHYASWFLLFARCNSRITAFLLPASWDGLSLDPIHAPYATRAAGAARLILNNCKIPALYRLGKEGAGLDWIAASCLDLGRFSVAAGALGVACAALDVCLAHLKSHPDLSAPLADEPMIQGSIGELVTEIQATKALAQQTIAKREQQTADATTMTTLTKYKAAKVAVLCTRNAMQLVGHRAFQGDSTLARLHRDAQCFPLIEGTENMNAITIAKAAYRGVFQ